MILTRKHLTLGVIDFMISVFSTLLHSPLFLSSWQCGWDVGGRPFGQLNLTHILPKNIWVLPPSPSQQSRGKDVVTSLIKEEITMPIVVNTNASATEASFNLSKANESLRKKSGSFVIW